MMLPLLQIELHKFHKFLQIFYQFKNKTFQMNIGKLKLKSTPQSHLVHTHQPKTSNQRQEKQEIQKIFDEKLKTKDKVITYQPVEGTGTIVSSGTSLVGNNTIFKTEISNGDYIIIENSLLKTTQEKQVMVVLGDKSILLKQPFVEEITSYSKFKIQKKQKIQKGEDIGQEYKKRLDQMKKTKQISKDTVELRVKKGMWRYQKQKVEVGKNASKEQLLNIRAKNIKDKFCW